ncbi:hypothetical protein GCM10010300_46250 [Streptomyces olivaceoviridis]|nr:hypothetical protein GCM10010300_46250 [Streptomyces olivaceoviridis]
MRDGRQRGGLWVRSAVLRSTGCRMLRTAGGGQECEDQCEVGASDGGDAVEVVVEEHGVHSRGRGAAGTMCDGPGVLLPGPRGGALLVVIQVQLVAMRLKSWVTLSWASSCGRRAAV